MHQQVSKVPGWHSSLRTTYEYTGSCFSHQSQPQALQHLRRRVPTLALPPVRTRARLAVLLLKSGQRLRVRATVRARLLWPLRMSSANSALERLQV